MKIKEETESKLFDYIENNLKRIEIESNIREDETFPSEDTLNQRINVTDEELIKELKEVLKDRNSFKIEEFNNISINIESKKYPYELTNKNTKIRLNNTVKEIIMVDIEIDEIISQSENYQYAQEEYLSNQSTSKADYYYDMMKDDMLTGN